MRQNRLIVGIGILGALLVMIAFWSVLRPLSQPPTPTSTITSAKSQTFSAPIPKPTAAATTQSKGATLWIRPSPEATSRNRRRSGFAWVMRQLGMTESQLNRLTDGDASGLVNELKGKAKTGDPTFINILGQLATINCRATRGMLMGFKKRQNTEAQASTLSQTDQDWFTSTANDDLAFDNQIDSLCDQIDTNEVRSWVTVLASQGDGASLWVLSQGLQMPDMQQRLREASAAGFALAQYSLALLINADVEGAVGDGPSKLNALELFNQAASAVPETKVQFALCEYFGDCAGIPVDIDAAIAHAREAAQEGYFNAVLTIGPHLPTGQMDPDEVEAWRLLDASVDQQGCGGNIFTVRAMQNITGTLNANNITPQARALAEQYWSDYGSQIMSSLGCTS